jgi:aspartate kinase
VQKYGGSSVADAAGIRRAAEHIVNAKMAGHSVVAVVSAMGDTTDDLIDLANKISPSPPDREMDMLLSAGERISAALVAMAVSDLGVESRSYAGSQAGLVTDSAHRKAKVVSVRPNRIQEALGEGAVAIVAGFQGVSEEKKDITTLGRGASDVTPVALAAAMNADYCEIYTDVDGIFSADPRIVPSARHIPVISHEEMLELAASGSKVLMTRSVEYARRYGIPIHVRSSFSNRQGTWVVGKDSPRWDGGVGDSPVIAVAQDRGQARVTIARIPGVRDCSQGSSAFCLMRELASR